MTNEELCAAYKAGNKAALAQLWEQNTGLLFVALKRLYYGFEDRACAAGVTLEDAIQTGFFAVERAAIRFDPQEGAKFSTYLMYYVKDCFFELVGLKTQREMKDPLASAERLEMTVAGDETEQTFGDTVPDPGAALEFDNVLDGMFVSQLRGALDKAMEPLSDRQAAALRLRYYGDRSTTETAQRLGIDVETARKEIYCGLREMRKARRILQQYADELFSRSVYAATGFCAWKAGGSIEERAAEWDEQARAKAARRLENLLKTK